MARSCTLLLMAGASLLALPACTTERGPSRPPTAPSVLSGVAPSAPTAARAAFPPVLATPYANAPVPDAQLARGIEQALARDPVLRAQPIHVSVLSDDVTITGTVPTLAATWRAARLVESFRGATSLTNQVAVNTPVRPDADIARDVRAAIRSDPATRNAKVQATVDAETVTLSGRVDSRMQRGLLKDIVARVRGVQQVKPELEVVQFSSRADAEIAADVTDALHDDARLDGSRIDVRVGGRNAAISGVVGSISQRDAAVDDAWVEGVTAVDASGLRVDWVANESARATARRQAPGDRHIADAAGRALSRDPRVGVQLPKVVVDQGVISLTGDVTDVRARNAAVGDTRGVSGVWLVEDRMTVLPVKRESDATIQARVSRAISDDLAAPDSPGVRVTTKDARVTLQGTVASEAARSALASDAEEAPGVVAVDDELKVQEYGTKPLAVAPESIRDAVLEDILWDPRVPIGKVTADVASNGDVTLSGTVDSGDQARSATGDAIRAGAPHVINTIRVAQESARDR